MVTINGKPVTERGERARLNTYFKTTGVCDQIIPQDQKLELTTKDVFNCLDDGNGQLDRLDLLNKALPLMLFEDVGAILTKYGITCNFAPTGSADKAKQFLTALKNASTAEVITAAAVLWRSDSVMIAFPDIISNENRVDAIKYHLSSHDLKVPAWFSEAIPHMSIANMQTAVAEEINERAKNFSNEEISLFMREVRYFWNDKDPAPTPLQTAVTIAADQAENKALEILSQKTDEEILKTYLAVVIDNERGGWIRKIDAQMPFNELFQTEHTNRLLKREAAKRDTKNVWTKSAVELTNLFFDYKIESMLSDQGISSSDLAPEDLPKIRARAMNPLEKTCPNLYRALATKDVGEK